MANNLSNEKQTTVISALAEGNSIRSIERMTGIHRDTIMRLGVKVGDGCAKVMDHAMRDLDCSLIQMDEIWGFVGKKQKHATAEDRAAGLGDVWTFVAIDAETRMVPVYRVGNRTGEVAEAFVDDLASRLNNRPQISTDAFHAYARAINNGFDGAVDYGQVVKVYSKAEHHTLGRYSPPKLVRVAKIKKIGAPVKDLISTSYAERQNLTMRMHMRRLTRLTNGFSKKLDNFKSAVALHFGYYNFVRVHKTLGMTPAMAGGVTDHVWTVPELVYQSSI
jgi:IS1 family transposase